MGSMEQGRRPRRSFTEQYKAEVVALCLLGATVVASFRRQSGDGIGLSSYILRVAGSGLMCALIAPDR
jgi:hypothetical protein